MLVMDEDVLQRAKNEFRVCWFGKKLGSIVLGLDPMSAVDEIAW